MFFARYLDNFIHCCYASAAVPGLQCESPGNEFSSCDDLMKNWALRACLWVLGISALLGNTAVIILRTILEKERRGTTQGRERRGARPGQERRVQPFLLINLAVSDFLMGIYLLIIAIKDTQWQGEYFKHDFDWRAGSVCQLAGALSMLSSEVSVVMLTLITFDRLVCVVFPFSNARLTSRKAYVSCAVIWVFGIFISCLPVMGMEYFSSEKSEAGFFGRSSVCLPLQLSEDKPAGWEYSVGFFIALNLFAFIFILVAYIAIYSTVQTSARRAGSTRMNQDAAMARKIMCIVLTDFCCWMPVIVIGILSLTGNFYDPKKLVYVVIAIFVLPVNSSINPILYTFSDATVRQALVNIVGRCGACFVAKCKPPVFSFVCVSVIVAVLLFFNQSIRQRSSQMLSSPFLRWRVQEGAWWGGCSKLRRGSRDGTSWGGCSKPRSSCRPWCGRSINISTEGKEIEADWRIHSPWRQRGECSKLDAGVSEGQRLRVIGRVRFALVTSLLKCISPFRIGFFVL